MATILFSPGDIFVSGQGAGIVLPSCKYLMIAGEGGRTGYRAIIVTVLPDDALPGVPQKLDVKFALDVAALAIKGSSWAGCLKPRFPSETVGTFLMVQFHECSTTNSEITISFHFW